MWLGRENEEYVAQMRNCCGEPSSPRLCFYLRLVEVDGNRVHLAISSCLIKLNFGNECETILSI